MKSQRTRNNIIFHGSMQNIFNICYLIIYKLYWFSTSANCNMKLIPIVCEKIKQNYNELNIFKNIYQIFIKIDKNLKYILYFYCKLIRNKV